MQYSYNKKKGNGTFYLILALCVLAVLITVFIVIGSNNSKEMKNGENSQINSIKEEVSSYSSNMVSGVESTVSSVKEKITEPTEKTESNIPYESSEKSKNSDIVKQSYVLPIEGNIIKGFSNEALQYDKTFGDMRIHTGIDIACEKNTQVKAVTSGKVLDILDTADYGKVITIDHNNGITVKYCGMGSVDVKKDEEITSGTIIGTADSVPCECMDENHIHIECYKDGECFSPLSALGF